jgi:phosphinothricin acetyltransferase
MAFTRMEIRLALESDLPAIVAIYNETIPGRMVTATLEPVTVDERLPWFREHDARRHPLWVACDDGELIAWQSLSTFNSRAAYDATAEISIYVKEGRRRAGLGRTLLAHAETAAPDLGLRTFVALVFGHNAPSVAFFERNGFARWGHLPNVATLDGVDRDLVYLGKRLW